ncbi:MAG: SLAP domain-containing protein [Lactobacillus sp.]|nr:SLAP domain-containing protein [Lactobacillus sp.]
MKLKKILLSALLCVAIGSSASYVKAFADDNDVDVQLTPDEEVEAASINNMAKQYSYSGTTYLYKFLEKKGIKYNKFYTKNKIKYRKGKPEGIVIHETATPGASADREAIYFNREWKSMYAYVHAFVDDKQVIQMMTPNYGVWGAGPIANSRFIQIELCEVSSKTAFAKSVNNDAIYVAKLLKRYNLKPKLADAHGGSGTIWSHHAVSKYLGGTDHTDPTGYFKKWGYSMSKFFDLVKYYYDGGENKSDVSSSSSTASSKAKTSSTSSTKTSSKASSSASSKSSVSSASSSQATSQKMLVRYAAIYTAKGNKTSTLLKPGTTISYTGTKTIKGKLFYQMAANKFVIANNIDGTKRTLTKKAYVYSNKGKIINKNNYFNKGNSYYTFGGQVKANGHKFYVLGLNVYVRAENFK